MDAIVKPNRCRHQRESNRASSGRGMLAMCGRTAEVVGSAAMLLVFLPLVMLMQLAKMLDRHMQHMNEGDSEFSPPRQPR